MLNMGDSHRVVEILLNHPGIIRAGAEIGVYRGETSAKLLKAFPELTLYMVDSWTETEEDSGYWKSGDGISKLSAEQQKDNMRAAMSAVQFASDRAIIKAMPSFEASEYCPYDLDFVFIDADHTYESTRGDITDWWLHVRDGGLLIGHDYGHPRNKRGLFGVNRAVDEFVEREDLDLHLLGSCWWVEKP